MFTLMQLRQKQADARRRAKAISDKALGEGRATLTADEQTEFNAAIQEAKSYEPMIANLEALQEAECTAPAIAITGVVVGHDNREDAPFNSLAEQMVAIRSAALAGSVDPRLRPLSAANGGNTTTPSEGGFLVAPEYLPTLVKRTFDSGVIAGRCFQQPMSKPRLVMPGVRDENRADGARWGGISTYWTSEAANYTKSKPTFREIALQVDKLTSLVYATDEQLDDAPAWDAYVQQAVPDELAFKTDDAILFGSGVGGGPLGIKNSGAILVVPKENGQAAATLTTNNFLAMYKRMPAYLRASAAWFINQDTEDQLWNLTIGTGTAVRLLYTPPGFNGNQYGMILGLPVIPIEQAQTCGTQGDVTLANFTQYALGRYGALKQDTSIHVAFLTGEQVFRFQLRVAGQSLWDKPVQPKNGANTLSPFVQLQNR